MDSSLTPVRRADNGLPLTPILTPAFGVAGAFLMVTGVVYCLIGIRQRSLHSFLTCAYLTSLGITVLIVYLTNSHISNAIQGGYFVAACVSGLIVGGLSLMVKSVAEQFGCLLGGFCFSMWLMTLRPGGLIQNSAGVAIFIIGMSLISYAVSFTPQSFAPQARSYAMLGCACFSGATAIVIGVDCLSRAGLKEFWVYIWGINKDLFPIDTTSYPLTKGICAEIGCIPVLFLFGLLSQIKLWKVVEARQNASIAQARLANDDREKQENAIARRVQNKNKRELGLWESTYGQKKLPNVTETPSSPESPTRPVAERPSSEVVLGKRLSTSQNLTTARVMTTEVDKNVETTAIPNPRLSVPTNETSIESIQVDKSPIEAKLPSARRDSFEIPKKYQSLRPRSNPPPPNLPSPDLPSIRSAGEGDGASSISSLDLLSADRFADLSDSQRFKVSSLNLTVDPALCPKVDEDEEVLTPALPGQWLDSDEEERSKDEQFDFERIASGDEADRDSIQDSIAAEEELAKTPDPVHAKPSRSASGIRLEQLGNGPGRVIHKATLDRISRWASMLDQAEDLESNIRQGADDFESGGTLSTHDGTDPEKMEHAESMWSGFEGAYSSTAATTEAARVEEQPTEKVPTTAPTIPSVQMIPRSKAAVNYKKCKSTQITLSASKAPILPLPIKSARVHERNASLPALKTPTFIEQREAIMAERQRHTYISHQYTTLSSLASSAKSPTIDHDDMTLAERKAILQHARRVSSGQVSLSSSTDPRSPSTATRSQEATTARTSPIPASPSYPAFAMAATPIRGSYPQPSYGFPNSSRRDSNAVSQPQTPVVGGTLLTRFEEQQRNERQVQAQKQVRHQAEEKVRKEKNDMEKRRRQMDMDEMMRRGHFEGAHQQALRRMQRIAARNAERNAE